MLGTCLIDRVGPLVGLNLDALKVMPGSTIFIFILSIVVNLLVSWVNRRTIDLEEYKEWTIKSTLVRREYMKAVQSGNKRLVDKLQKEQQEIMKSQSAMTMQQLKFQLFFFIPFIALWQILGVFFANAGTVAYMPFNAPFFGTELSLFSWYFICSIATSILTRRLLGLTFEVP
ncbi:MAG: EMC3/TMCO1 family protein [Candidatus Bathyarchaeia archaeon]